MHRIVDIVKRAGAVIGVKLAERVTNEHGTREKLRPPRTPNA